MPIDLGQALDKHRRGQTDLAVSDCEAALAENPRRDEALHLLGLIAFGNGNLALAVELIGRAVALRPDSTGYRSSLAGAYRELGQTDRALECAREAIRLRPDDPGLLSDLGSTLVDSSDVEAAAEILREAIRLRPDCPRNHNNMGRALALLGDSAGALAHFRLASTCDPGSAEAHANLAKVLLERGDVDGALRHGREAIRLRPDFVEALVILGNVFQVLDRLAEAEACLCEAIRLRPGSAPVLAGLGAIREQLGDSEASLEAFREALRHDPHHAGVLARLATRLGNAIPEAERGAIEALLAEPGLAPDRRTPLLFGLAHVLDAERQFDRAAALSLQANAGQLDGFERSGRGYDPAAHRRFVDGLIEAFTPAFFERVQGRGVATDRPIFVVGMPRSGTSLVEQILASHPRVFGAGELRLAGDAFKALAEVTGHAGTLAACLECLEGEGMHRLGRRYLDGLEARGVSAERVVDKMPENSLFLGLMAALLPGARLIHCRRDRRDVAISCWMTHFGQVRWTCSADHITTRIAESARLMDHWRRSLPAPILEVDYEAIVDDLEGQSRRLLGWCGLDWDSACLRFHETRRVVRTASTMQVRRPIYRGSIGRWKNYEGSLESLFEAS